MKKEVLQKTIENINKEFADINAIMAARSRELDRRERFDKEISQQIHEILKTRKADSSDGRTPCLGM